MERNTLMLCRPYSEGTHLMFRCGGAKFVVASMHFQPEEYGCCGTRIQGYENQTG